MKKKWYSLKEIASFNDLSYNKLWYMWKLGNPALPRPDVIVAEIHPCWKSLPTITKKRLKKG